jgi:HlyD family secretion protein
MIKTLLPLLWISLFFFSCGNKKNEKNSMKDTASVRIREVTQIVGVASIEPKARIVSLYSETGGVIKKIYHDINDDLKEGDLIMEMDSDVEKAQLQQARSKLLTQGSTINYFKSQEASLQTKLQNAKENYERNERLYKTGGVTKKDLDDSRFNYESMKDDLQAATANVSQQQNKLKEFQSDINYYEKILERKEIKAPANGKILSIDVKVGNSVSSSQAVGDFAPEGPLMAITEVDELFADQVKLGMRAYIRPQGKTDTLAWGKIFLASPYLRKKSLFSDAATNMEDRRVREVRVLLDDKAAVLIGSRVECVILVK